MLDPDCIAHAREVLAAASRCGGPVAAAEILPAQAYVSESFWEFEKEAIFAREWLCVGHVNEVPDPGDYLPVDILGEPLLLVRDQDGEVRVLSAVCRHRGHPMARGVAAPGPGKACLHGERLVCPYHNWAYALDGRLLSAPEMQQTTPVRDLRESVRLPQLRSELFHGLVFVNFDRDAAPLAPALRRLDRELATYDLGSLVPVQGITDTALPWNWKLHQENALEPYHTDYLHKGLHEQAPTRLTQFCAFEPGDGHVMRWTGMLDPESDHWETGGVRRLPPIPTLTDEQRKRVLFLAILPNLVGVLQPNSVSITCLDPSGAGTMNSRRVNLYPQAAVAMDNFDHVRADRLKHLKAILEQDKATLTVLQEAYRSRFAPRGKLSHWEEVIVQIHAWLVARYLRALDELDRPR